MSDLAAYVMLSQIAKMADTATDEILSEAAKIVLSCGDAKNGELCEECQIRMEILKLLHKYREIRKVKN